MIIEILEMGLSDQLPRKEELEYESPQRQVTKRENCTSLLAEYEEAMKGIDKGYFKETITLIISAK